MATIQTHFKVVSVSSNHNSFGLYGVIICDKSGLAFEIGVSQYNLPNKGNIVTGQVTEKGNLHSLPFGYEIPRKLAAPDAATLAEIWPKKVATNLTLKAVYFCATNKNSWGKGYTVAEAKKNAGLKKADEKKTQFYVMAAIFNNPTSSELDNLFACITANQVSGSPEYYKDGRTDEDTDMILDKHVGWLTIEKNYE